MNTDFNSTIGSMHCICTRLIKPSSNHTDSVPLTYLHENISKSRCPIYPIMHSILLSPCICSKIVHLQLIYLRETWIVPQNAFQIPLYFLTLYMQFCLCVQTIFPSYSLFFYLRFYLSIQLLSPHNCN